MVNRPFGPTGVRAFISGFSNAMAAKTSGISFEADTTGRGLVVFRYEVTAGIVIAFRQSAVPVLDESLTVITPTMISDPAATLTTVIRTGVEGAGLILIPPDYFFRRTVSGDILGGHEIFVPPGHHLTFMKLVVNTAFNFTVGFTEL